MKLSTRTTTTGFPFFVLGHYNCEMVYTSCFYFSFPFVYLSLFSPVLSEGCFWLQQKPIFRNSEFGGSRFCCYSGILSHPLQYMSFILSNKITIDFMCQIKNYCQTQNWDDILNSFGIFSKVTSTCFLCNYQNVFTNRKQIHEKSEFENVLSWHKKSIALFLKWRLCVLVEML